MYASRNFKTKKALKEAVKGGEKVGVFSPGPFPAKTNGTEFLEGPWAPEMHRWYAKVKVSDGVIVKVI